LVSSLQQEAEKAKEVADRSVQRLQALPANDIRRTKIMEPAINYFSSKLSSLKSEQISIQPQIIRTDIELNKYVKRNKSGIKSAGRVFIIALAPTLLRIFIALLTILNDPLVTEVIVLDPVAIIRLIGLGLATGSLKQLVDKN
jgi:hypothetical protein